MKLHCLIFTLAYSFNACVNNANPQSMNDSRKSLQSKLINAIRDSITICDIEAFVGQKPIVNTCSDADRLIIQHANIDADINHSGDFPKLIETKDVTYWLVSHETSYTRVIGIYWPLKGMPKLFHARVYPP